MRKKCTKCGNTFYEDVKFCTNCGSNELALQKQYYIPQNDQLEHSLVYESKKYTKAIAVAMSIVLIMALIVASLIMILDRKPYQNILDIIEDSSVGEVEIEDIKSLAPETVWKIAKKKYEDIRKQNSDILPNDFDTYIEESYKQIIEKIKEKYKENKREYGNNFSGSVEVLREEEVEDKIYKKITKYLEDEYDIDADVVGRIYDITLKVVSEGDKKIYVETLGFSVIEIDDEWYPISHYESEVDGVKTYVVRFS